MSAPEVVEPVPEANGGDVRVREAGPADAATVVRLIHESFAGRPALDPPATAEAETEESVREALAEHGGLLVSLGETPVGTLLLLPDGEGWLGLRRVGVVDRARRTGAAPALVAAAETYAAEHGYVGLRLLAREELPGTVRFWERLGYDEATRTGPHIGLRKRLPVTVDVPTPEDMRDLGQRLARTLRPGDLVILTGDLGAGKTTLTQGIGEGLGVRGAVTSPTFVIARVHPGPVPLVHVDAYRLTGAAELDDLDLDTDLADGVTVVEWGEGLAEVLARDRLEVALRADPTTERRTAVLTPVGRRWLGEALGTDR